MCEEQVNVDAANMEGLRTQPLPVAWIQLSTFFENFQNTFNFLASEYYLSHNIPP